MIIYISALNGNDLTGDGTKLLPYATFEKAKSTIPTYLNGNHVTMVVDGGTYNEVINIRNIRGGNISIKLSGDVVVNNIYIDETTLVEFLSNVEQLPYPNEIDTRATLTTTDTIDDINILNSSKVNFELVNLVTNSGIYVSDTSKLFSGGIVSIGDVENPTQLFTTITISTNGNKDAIVADSSIVKILRLNCNFEYEHQIVAIGYGDSVISYNIGTIGIGVPYDLHDGSMAIIDGIEYTKTITKIAEIEFLNGWKNYGGDYGIVNYQKDEKGFVHLSGMIKSGLLNKVAFVLEDGFRPTQKTMNIVLTNGTVGRLNISADGSVIPCSGNNSWVSLDGISFPTR